MDSFPRVIDMKQGLADHVYAGRNEMSDANW